MVNFEIRYANYEPYLCRFHSFLFLGFYVFALGPKYVNAYNAMSNTNSVFFCTIIGLGVSTVSFTCNEFGQNNSKKAKTYT